MGKKARRLKKSPHKTSHPGKRPRKRLNKTKLFIALAAIAGLANFSWQIYHKPLELWSLLPVNLAKTPTETWQAYGDEFIEYENNYLPATFLAALAQKESSGNPWASPGWIMRLSENYGRLYSPQSSAFGLLQITRPTLQQILQLCDRPQYTRYCALWNSRLFATDSIALTVLNLSHKMKKIERKFGIKKWNKSLKTKIAAIIHLCGEGVANRYARQGFRFGSIRYCGTHNVRRYVQSVKRLKRRFEKIAGRTH